MQGTRMVPLTAVPTEFAGRVIVAKLGSAGILAELRGVSPVYPAVLGEPHVWVEADEWADARELISTDVDDVLAVDDRDDHDPWEPGRQPVPRWARPAMVAVALLLLMSFGLGMRSCATGAVINPPAGSRH